MKVGSGVQVTRNVQCGPREHDKFYNTQKGIIVGLAKQKHFRQARVLFNNGSFAWIRLTNLKSI